MNRANMQKIIRCYRNFKRRRQQISDARSYFKIAGVKPDLTAKERAQIRELWGPLGWRGRGEWHAWYKHVSGKFDPRYVPSEVYATEILPRFSNLPLGKAWADKAYFDARFPGVRFPHTILRRIDGLFIGGEYEPVSELTAVRLLSAYEKVFVKPSIDSGVGRGAMVWDISSVSSDSLLSALRSYGQNYVVQELIAQHPLLSALNDSSINVVRINSFRWREGVAPLNAIVRFGGKGSHTDFWFENGIEMVNIAQVHLDGRIDDAVYSAQGERSPITEYGVDRGAIIPNFEKALAIVSRMHERQLHHFDIVGFDVAFDGSGHPVIVEFNPSFPGITFPQYACGPMFGDRTEEVIVDIVSRPIKGLGR